MPQTTITRPQAKGLLLHTPDVRDEGHKPAVFDFSGSPAQKAEMLVKHLHTVTAQHLALEQLRRGTKIVKIDAEIAALRPGVTLAGIAFGNYR